MSERSSDRPFAAGPWLDPGFWDGVKEAIETLDSGDFEAFLRAGELPTGPPPEFEAELHQRLLALFRDRYGRG